MCTIQQIFNEVCLFYGVNEKECLTDSRKRVYVKPRQVYAALAKELTKESLSAIGLLIKKDHATVLHSNKTVSDERDTNPIFNQEYKELLARLSIQKQNKPAMTKLCTNEAQTILHIVVMNKVVSSHRFVAFTGNEDFAQEDTCVKCCFKTIKCDGIPCCAHDRKDKQSGYYETIE